jgi:hypothetical protein
MRSSTSRSQGDITLVVKLEVAGVNKIAYGAFLNNENGKLARMMLGARGRACKASPPTNGNGIDLTQYP